jgi:TonB family protein
MRNTAHAGGPGFPSYIGLPLKISPSLVWSHTLSVMSLRTFMIAVFLLSTTTGSTSSRAQNPPIAPKRVEGILRYPACVQCPDPQPTREARIRHVQGIVALEATITERGEVGQVAIVKGLDYGLTQRAIRTVRRWRIRPAIGIDGKPRALRIAILVTFGVDKPRGGVATG